ncbi:DNA-binding GntR family transcriptional regulator [Pedobacter sp. AK017]|uniref:hypothetical protein n=1 Tax=Pedobacter sp. AK017 TaxID=2723073 RepID=UPI001622B040|nr:hypothetical protein [Pedobacter sp. AK017]MBB5436948.1 DNA-binding GntR family transcriptional regulator [Pedobacter sp. AK017]
MNKISRISFEPENVLSTHTIMAMFGISRAAANAILWDLFDKGYIDLIPELNQEMLGDNLITTDR